GCFDVRAFGKLRGARVASSVGQRKFNQYRSRDSLRHGHRHRRDFQLRADHLVFQRDKRRVGLRKSEEPEEQQTRGSKLWRPGGPGFGNTFRKLAMHGLREVPPILRQPGCLRWITPVKPLKIAEPWIRFIDEAL